MAGRRRVPTVEQVQIAFDEATDKLSRYLSGLFDFVNATDDKTVNNALEIEDLKAMASVQGQRINELLEHTDCEAEPVPTNTGSAKKAGARKKAPAKKAPAKKAPAAKKKAAAQKPDDDGVDDLLNKGSDPSKLMGWVEKFLAKKNKKKATRVSIVQEALQVFGAGTVADVPDDETDDFRDKVKALYDEAE